MGSSGHAFHHFTQAAAVDGSVNEDEMPNHRCRRRVAFGVYEGLYQADGLNTHQQGVWGGRLPADLEVADAEMYAIHEYLQKVLQNALEPTRLHNVYSYRVTVLSPQLG